jgi:hypothetical protein
MRAWSIAAVAATLAALSCASQSSQVVPSPGSTPVPVLGSPFSDQRMGYGAGDPLILDRTDLRIGTTVQFRRLPTEGEIHDLGSEPGLMRVVLALPSWPAGFEPIEPLNRLPAEVDILVILPGYPPNRAAADVWNYLGTRPRVVVVAQGPPPDVGLIQDLNAMRGLERVIVDLDVPARTGFERLQRPLSFRRRIE